MSDLVLGSTTVLSDSSGTPTIQRVAFPAGMITDTIVRKYAFDTNTSYGNQTTSEKIFTRESDTSTTVSSFTAKQGYTYIINMIYYGYVARQSGNNSGRVGYVRMYYGTTLRSQGDTSFDTRIHFSLFGRDLAASASSGGNASFALVNMVGSFYQSSADTTVYYYGTSYQGSADKTQTMYLSSSHPGYDIIYEIKGNKLTTET